MNNVGPVYRPANAGLVLALGILSIVLFPPLGPIAWIIGNNELRAIDSGAADPMQRRNVAAGRTCGIIGTVILTLAIIVGIAMTVFGAFVLKPALQNAMDTGSSQSTPVVVGQQSHSISEAIVSGNEASVKEMLAKDPTLANKKNATGQTPLFDAAFVGNTAIARDLIDAGADVNATDEFGKRPLDNAEFFHRDAVIQLLKQHGARNGKGPH